MIEIKATPTGKRIPNTRPQKKDRTKAKAQPRLKGYKKRRPKR